MKIKYSIIEKLHNLSRCEWDLFLYVVKAENQTTGIVEGVFYLDVIKHTGMCKQSFYNAMRGLEDKGIVSVHRNSEVDYDICIIDNAFPTEREHKEGYVNLNRKAFHSKAFKGLKSHEKYLALEFLKCTHENAGSMRVGVKRFYERFTGILGVTKKVLRGYLHDLKLFFSIGIKDGNYFITYMHSVFKKLQNGDKDWKSERNWHLEGLVKKECHRGHIKYDRESMQDIAYLAIQYQEYSDKKQLLEALMGCIRKSIEGIRYSERQLQSKYIHKLIRQALGLPVNA